MVSGMRVITVVNWDCYQLDQQGNAQDSNKKSNKKNNSSSTTDLTGNQQANQQASNNNIRNNKNNKKDIEDKNPYPPENGGTVPEGWTDDDEYSFQKQRYFYETRMQFWEDWKDFKGKDDGS
jgi:hypothetical protein